MKKLEKLTLRELQNDVAVMSYDEIVNLIGGCGEVEGEYAPPKSVSSIASGLIGTCEVPGAGNNPTILAMLATCTYLPAEYKSQDATAWCSAFVNYCMIEAGKSGTNSAAASSWNNWGTSTSTPSQGDVAVFKNISHVGIVSEDNGDGTVTLICGNSGDCVSYETVKKSDLTFRTN